MATNRYDPGSLRNLNPDEFDPKKWSDENEPLMLPHEVPWYHGSRSPEITGGTIDTAHGPGGREGGPNFFTHDAELAAGYGDRVYQVEPPRDTAKWDVAVDLLEAEYDPEYAQENPAHEFDQVTSAFSVNEPLKVLREVPTSEVRERSKLQSGQFGNLTRPSDIWGKRVDDDSVPWFFEGGNYRAARDEEWQS